MKIRRQEWNAELTTEMHHVTEQVIIMHLISGGAKSVGFSCVDASATGQITTAQRRETLGKLAHGGHPILSQSVNQPPVVSPTVALVERNGRV